MTHMLYMVMGKTVEVVVEEVRTLVEGVDFEVVAIFGEEEVVSRTQIRIVGPLGAVEGDSRAEVGQQREETKAEELTEEVLQVELGAVEGDKFRKECHQMCLATEGQRRLKLAQCHQFIAWPRSELMSPTCQPLKKYTDSACM